MGRMLTLSAVLLALLPAPLLAHMIYVHPGGAGDCSTIPEGVANATIDDTVLVAAGTYVASGAGWPIALLFESPTIMSEDGVRFNGSSTIPVHWNDIYDNTLYNLKIEGYCQSHDATMNWWGSSELLCS